MSLTDLTDRASELVEQIDTGELDPADVDVSEFVDAEQVFTPELADRLSDEQVQRYNKLSAEQGVRELHEHHVELSEQEADARDALLDVDTPETETVKLGSGDEQDPPTLDVRTEIPGWMEQHVNTIGRSDSVDEALDAIFDLLCGPQDSNRKGLIISPEEYASRQAWRDVYTERGSVYLWKRVEEIAGPAMERQEELEQVKNLRGGGEERPS